MKRLVIINKQNEKVMYTTSSNTIAWNTIPCPEAYITRGKNRLRQNGNTVYLRNNDEFEIELFNPKTTKVLAKIKLNGIYISQRGLVLKPGQRIHLDRYIDVAKRFAFSTYEVEAGNSAVEQAIMNNGDVQIEFFDQYIPVNTIQVIPTYPNWLDNGLKWDYNQNPTVFYTNTASHNLNQPVSSYHSKSVLRSASKTLSADYNEPTLDCMSFAPQPQALKETGRVEEGGYSNTRFGTDNTDFNAYASHTVSWKIMPESQAPVAVGEVRNYCPNCQYRIRKSNWKFCPNCSSSLH